MTILSATSRMTYTGNGGASNYSFTYKIFNEEDLLVTVRHPTTGAETELTLTTDYTVTIASNGTGSITLVDADQAWLTGAFLTTAWVLVIRRVVDLTQETDIRNQGAFFPENHEDAFDYLMMSIQQVQDEVSRSLKVNETDDPLTLTMPTATERASQFLGFDADGEPIASAAVSSATVSAFMQTVLDDTTAADARTTLGFTGTGGTVATANIEDLAVTTGKLAANAVTLAKASTAFVHDATQATAASGDFALIADTDAANVVKKVPLSEIFFPTTSNALAGSVVQVVNYQTSALQTGTTTLVADDTIPQNTEGNEFMTLAITPKSATNKLKITVNAFTGMSTGIGTVTTMALFQDSTADAIAATVTSAPQAHAPISSTLVHYMTAGTTSATTFKVRMGLNGVGTITFNGANSGRLYGGVAASSITIEEIKV